MTRVAVRPELLQWAVEGSDCEAKYLSERFPGLGDWKSGKTQPTFKQLEKFAKVTQVPVWLPLPEGAPGRDYAPA